MGGRRYAQAGRSFSLCNCGNGVNPGKRRATDTKWKRALLRSDYKKTTN